MRLLLFAVLTILACSSDSGSSKKLVEDKEMIDILVDYHLVQSFHELKGLPQDTLNLYNNKHFNVILEDHGVDRADFQSTFDYYLQHPQEFYELYDKVVAELDSVAAAQ